jgi:hypothetical protein
MLRLRRSARTRGDPTFERCRLIAQPILVGDLGGPPALGEVDLV